MLGVLFAPAWTLVRSILACSTTLVKQSCGIERHRVKSCDYIRESSDVKGKTDLAAESAVNNSRIFTEIWQFAGPSETKKL